MTLRDILAREHTLFSLVLDALDRALEAPAGRAVAQIDRALRVLLPALDRHEDLEDGVFGREHLLVQQQHDALGALRLELLDILEIEECVPRERLTALTRFLVASLREHLTTEEVELWPHHRQRLDAELDPERDVALVRRARLSEKHLRRGLASIAAAER